MSLEEEQSQSTLSDMVVILALVGLLDLVWVSVGWFKADTWHDFSKHRSVTLPHINDTKDTIIRVTGGCDKKYWVKLYFNTPNTGAIEHIFHDEVHIMCVDGSPINFYNYRRDKIWLPSDPCTGVAEYTYVVTLQDVSIYKNRKLAKRYSFTADHGRCIDTRVSKITTKVYQDLYFKISLPYKGMSSNANHIIIIIVFSQNN